jgi:hypothetical protein
MEHDTRSKTDGERIRACIGGDTLEDGLGSRASLLRKPLRSCLAEECRGGLEARHTLSVEGPLQQRQQVRPGGHETEMPVQEYRPDRLSVQESTGCRWEAVSRDRLQEIFGHPTIPSDTGIDRTSLKQELDDLPAIKRKELTPGKTHQDILA